MMEDLKLRISELEKEVDYLFTITSRLMELHGENKNLIVEAITKGDV